MRPSLPSALADGTLAGMITAVHGLLYADDPVAARAFFRDVLGFEHVDAGDGWLIFRTGPSEVGVHPTAGEGWSIAQHHEIAFVCDDIEQTMGELRDRGAVFTRGIEDAGFGLTTLLEVPGAGEILLYQPKHPTAYDR